MKLIPLTQGKFAKVDDEDFESLNQFEWRVQHTSSCWYAVRNTKDGDGKMRMIIMHDVIMPNPPTGMEVDHKNRDGLDNQKANLRFATHQQNMWNRKPNKNNTSGFTGVRLKRRKVIGGFHYFWIAYIRMNGKHRQIGIYKSPEEAARAYDKTVKELRGQFARTNF